MKQVRHCPTCRSDKHARFSVRKHKLCRCNACGLVFVPVIPNDVISIYRDDRRSSPTQYYQASRVVDEIVFDERLAYLENFTRKKTLLEVGCSIGTLLTVARNRGWSGLLGIEPNPVAARMCQSSGVEVINEPFSSRLLSQIDRKFSAIVLFDVIEHIEDPIELINTIEELLLDDGVVLITTPNYSSILTRLLQIKPAEHLFYFDRTTISRYLKKQGYEILVIEECSRPHDYDAMKFGTTTLSSFTGRLLSRLVVQFRLQTFVNFLFARFIRNELLVIARKPSCRINGNKGESA